MSSPTRLRVRLLLALGAAEVHLRLGLSVLLRLRPRGLLAALTGRPPAPEVPFAELVRIESDPVYRALFCAELNSAIESRYAAGVAVVDDVEAAADRLRSIVRLPDADERAA
ncbi:hypothetical protein [Streptomyces sp. NPDC048142]|uniref:hypothetical protein n=1 Tax=Streptomyces sp. NPDC048142 TaxID=3365501 RepID=UPI00372172E9